MISDIVDDNTKLVAVFGRPARPTPTPSVLNAVFRRRGLKLVSVACEVRTARGAADAIRELGIVGAAVTIPLKEHILSAVDYFDDATAAIGAANTLIAESGRLRATNTDWRGLLAAVGGNGKFSGKTCVILGAGGAARAAVYAARVAGAVVHVLNRTAERAARVAHDLNVEKRYFALTDLSRIPYDVLINATSVGLYDKHAAVISETDIRKGSLVIDFVFAPSPTKLLIQANRRQCETVDGVNILAGQAVDQIQAWSGEIVSHRELEAEFRAVMARH